VSSSDQRDSDVPTRQVRVSLGPYQLEGQIGSGGMGTVHRATGPDGRPVAIKVVAGPFQRPDLAVRFAREARVRISHPNVVELLDAGTSSDGTPYIVFELLEGEDLEARLARGPLPLGELVDIAMQACDGLEAAHALGIVHRDLKPANLFRCTDGTVKILDFGVALPLSQHTRLTTEAALLGTPAYLSPEQARGDLGVDSRADLWALGAVLYEALTGAPPYLRSSALATILAVVREELVPVSARATAVPEPLCQVVERALRKDRNERYQTARELRAALAALDPASLTERSSVVVPLREEPGEQRVVAILLADRVRDWALLERAIVDAGGHFERLMGERAVGVFGAERSSGNEAVRAARAAMEAELAASFVAVSAGRATLRGTQVSGSVLDVVERVCVAHFPGVVVDTETARLLEGSFQTVRLDDGLLRLVADSSGEEGMVVDRVPATGALLGRDAEVAQLRQAVRSVTDDGRAVVVWIEAPAGMGKSRLRREAERVLESAPVPFETFRARAEPSQAEVALSVIANLVKSRFAADSPTTTRASLPGRPSADAVVELARTALAGADDAHVRECAAFLGELAGVEVAENETMRMAWHDPQLVADRIRLAVLDLFEGVAAHSATALVLEDLQWADAESLKLLDDLVGDLASSPLLVLVTARPELRESRPALFAGRDVVRIEPRGLPLGDVAALARGLAGRTLAEPLVKRVADRSGGNPLFVEQIVLALGEDGLLDAPDTELPLPLTVEAAVQTRLDHLPAAEKDLCKRASVLGRPFADDELEALGVLDPKTLLASLARRDLVVPAGRARGSTRREHQFRSRLVQDVSYRMIAPEVCTELHKRIATTLDARPEADAEEIATHWDRGDVPKRAAARYAQAVVAAARRGDGPTVLRCSQRALALGAPEEALFQLHIARAEALRFAGRRAEQGMSLAHAIETARTDAEKAEATSKRAAWLARMGRADEALDLAQEAVRIARLDRTPDILASALGDLGGVLFRAGKIDQAREALAQATEVAERASVSVRAQLAGRRGELAGGMGDLGARREEYARAADLFRSAGDLREVAKAEGNLADACNRFGAHAEAEASLSKVLEANRRLGNRTGEGYALANLGYAMVAAGRTQDALDRLEAAGAIGLATNDQRLLATVRVYRARALLHRGDPVDQDGLRAVADTAGATLSALAMTLLARSARKGGALPVAIDHARRALATLEANGGIEEDETEVYATATTMLELSGMLTEAADVRARWAARVSEVSAGIRDAELRSRFQEAQRIQFEQVAASLE